MLQSGALRPHRRRIHGGHGADGLREAAEQSVSKAHYLAGLLQNAGLSLKYGIAFFNEFVTISKTPAADILAALEKRGISAVFPSAGMRYSGVQPRRIPGKRWKRSRKSSGGGAPNEAYL